MMFLWLTHYPVVAGVPGIIDVAIIVSNTCSCQHEFNRQFARGDRMYAVSQHSL
jgi:hypothetical protein